LRIAIGIPRSANGLTLGEYLSEWLEVCRRRLRPKTFESYALCVQRIEVQRAAGDDGAFDTNNPNLFYEVGFNGLLLALVMFCAITLPLAVLLFMSKKSNTD
jgi:hypothetical protein